MIAVAAGRAMEAMRVADGWLTTSGAGMRAVPWVNIYHQDPSLQSFVFYKPLELGEGPRVVDIPLLLPYPCPLPDMGQLLHHDNITLSEAIHNPSAYVVVNPANYSALFIQKLFQKPSCSSRAFGLESRPQSLIPPPDMHSLLARKSKSVGSCGKIIDSKVYPHHLAIIPRRRSLDRIGKNNIDVEILASANEVSMGRLLSLKKVPLVVANSERNLNSPFNLSLIHI